MPAAPLKKARPRPSRAAPSAEQIDAPRPARRSRRRDDVVQAEALRKQVERLARTSGPARWNANPDDVQRSVVKLVLTIVEFLRQLLIRPSAGWTPGRRAKRPRRSVARCARGTVRDLGEVQRVRWWDPEIWGRLESFYEQRRLHLRRQERRRGHPPLMFSWRLSPHPRLPIGNA
jgi:hypothetical protein